MKFLLSTRVAVVVCLLASFATAHSDNDHEHHTDHDHHHHHHHYHRPSVDQLREEPLKIPEPVDPGEPMVYHRCIHNQIVMRNPPVVHQSYDQVPVWKQRLNHAAEAAAAGVAERREYVEQSVTYNNMRFKYFFNVDGLGTCTTPGVFVNSYQNGNQMTNCTDASIMTSLKQDYILNTLMANAATFLSAALNVIRVNGTLVAPASCHGITTPSSHQSAGISDADFVAYVTAVPLASSSNADTVAWATTCSSDQNGRPTFGHVNFVPSALVNAATRTEYKVDQDTHTAIHELCHALGFSGGAFGPYLDAGGNYISSGQLVTSTDATLGKSVTKMISPRALAAARTHTGCSTLDGVEIEDDGGAGTGGSHWEKRIYYLEFICGILSSIRTYVTSMTLGYFEDTGHYTANYYMAEDEFNNFGKNRGCSFVTKKCNDDSLRSLPEYCWDRTLADQSSSPNMYCSTDFLARGYCGVTAFSSSLPNNEQYFAGSNIGGSVQLPDYCPSVLPYSNFVCIDGSAKDTQNIYGNTYGASSRCFQSSVIAKGYTAGSPETEARCFPVTCSQTGAIQINVQGQTALCPTDGTAGDADMSAVTNFQGSIKCPVATMFCRDPSVPTPAPTPTPPTPQPTPAPPGYTPQPAPFTRPPTPAPTFADKCVDRPACADQIKVRLPWCRAFAEALVDCFGTTCDSELAKWLSNNGAACTDSFSWGNQNCVEGPSGGAAMCALLNM